MFHRKLELSSMFGPPERESLYIPESEYIPLVMICLEKPFHSRFLLTLARSIKQNEVEQTFLGEQKRNANLDLLHSY